MIDENKLIEEIKSMVRSLLTPDGTAWFDDAIQAHNETIVDVLNAIERQPKVGEWIPVEEGLPKKYNGFYEINLVTLENGHVCFGVYRYDSNEWWTRMSKGETVYLNKHKVIAWMPLPEPYIKEEK